MVIVDGARFQTALGHAQGAFGGGEEFHAEFAVVDAVVVVAAHGEEVALLAGRQLAFVRHEHRAGVTGIRAEALDRIAATGRSGVFGDFPPQGARGVGVFVPRVVGRVRGFGRTVFLRSFAMHGDIP